MPVTRDSKWKEKNTYGETDGRLKMLKRRKQLSIRETLEYYNSVGKWLQH